MSDAILDVYLGDEPVGVIERTGRRPAAYRPTGDRRLSMAQLRDRPWGPDFTHAWFENVLPEEETRDRIAGRFGLRRDDTYGLLEEIGWECAGAVSVLPPGKHPVRGDYQELSLDDLFARLDALPRRPLDDDRAVRMSLGGGQSKMVARLHEGRWLLPIDGSPSTHILKPEPTVFPGLARAEAWSLAVAASAAPAASASVLAVDGHAPTLVVERYDRTLADDGQITRIHQEDGCQILGVEPGGKYADPPSRRGQPSYARMAEILLREARSPLLELSALLRFVTVHVALGNTDAHAKNISFLHDSERLMAVAPLYDIVPTAAFIEQPHFGLPVAGRFRIHDIGVEQLVAEARTWRLPERSARSVVGETVEAVRAGVAAADARIPDVPSSVRHAAIASIERLAAS